MTHLGERISALVDGELGPSARDRALAHVAGCGDCRARLDVERRAKTVVSRAPDPELPSGLTDRLLALGGPGAPLSPRSRPMPGGGFPPPVPPPGRPVAAAARRPSPYTSARSGPGAAASRALSRRTRRRVGALAGGTLSLSGLALGAAFWLGAPPTGQGVPGQPLQPPVGLFENEHLVTFGGQPLRDPAAGAAEARFGQPAWVPSLRSPGLAPLRSPTLSPVGTGSALPRASATP